MRNVNNLTTTILKEPNMRTRPEFQNVRNLVDAASILKCSKNTSTSAIVHADGNDMPLQIGFVQSIESGLIFNTSLKLSSALSNFPIASNETPKLY